MTIEALTNTKTRFSSSKIINGCVIFTFLALLIICCAQHISTDILPGYLLYDIKRIAELALLTVVILALLCQSQQLSLWLEQLRLLPKQTRILLASVLAIGFCSTALAPIPSAALTLITLYLSLFVWIFFVAMQSRIWQDASNTLWLTIILLSVGFYIIVFYIALFSQTNSTQEFNYFPGFSNVRFFSHYQIWTLPLITVPIYLNRQQPIIVKLPLYLIAMLWSMLLFFGGAKGLLAAIVLSTLAVLVMFRRDCWPWLRDQFICYAGGLLLFITNVVRHPSIPSIYESFSYKGFNNEDKVFGSVGSRLSLWQHAWTVVKNKWLLGVGPLHFSYYPNPTAAHPHNSIILFATEWGIPAALMMVAIVLWGLWRWSRFVQKKPVPLLIALTASLLAGLLYSLVDGVIVTPLSQLMMCLIVGWVIGIYYQQRTSEPQRSHRTIKLIATLCLLLVLTSAAWLIFPQIKKLPNQEALWTINHISAAIHALYPRLWAQGWLQ